MEHVWSVLNSRTIVDERKRMVSMIDACDVLQLPEEQVPEFDPKSKETLALGGVPLYLASMWMRSTYDKGEKGLARWVLTTPDGKRYPQPELKIDLSKNPTARAILVADKLVYRGLGLYFFLVEKKKSAKGRWIRVAKLPLVLRVEPTSPADNAED